MTIDSLSGTWNSKSWEEAAELMTIDSLPGNGTQSPGKITSRILITFRIEKGDKADVFCCRRYTQTKFAKSLLFSVDI